MTQGFLPDDQLRNEAAAEPWKRSETDRMLDGHFAGAHPNRIAQVLGRNPKAVTRRIEQFTNNERDFAIKYQPFRRASRKGKRFTENELLILKAHEKKGVPTKCSARLLQRDEIELRPIIKDTGKIKKFNVFAPTVDLCLALRFVFFQFKKRVVTDAEYDDLVTEEIEYGGAGEVLGIGADPRNVPPRIVSLALYLSERWTEEHAKEEPK